MSFADCNRYFLFLAKVLKIYGDTLNPEIPYKTLLLLPVDTTETVIRDVLNKYGVGQMDVSDFQLIQVYRHLTQSFYI